LGDSITGKSFVEYHLYTDSGEYVQIYPTAPVPMSYSGKEVKVSGIIIQLEGRMALNATSITPIDAPSASYSPVVSGTRKIAMLLLKYSDSAAYTPNDPTYYQNLMNPTANSVNAFYREESYGSLGVQADVYGWYTLPRPRSYYVYGTLSTCGVYFDRIITDGKLVTDPYVYFPQYDDVSFVMNDYLDCCAWGGSATITADGQSKMYGTTYEPPWGQTVGTYAHEIGHSLGCPHTGWIYGTYDSIWDVESGGTFFNGVLRGSYYSVAKGQTVNLYAYNPCHHVAYHKIKLGWLDTWYSEVISGTQTLTLNALAGTRISVMAVKVRIPGQDPSKRYFTVEARTKIYYDQWLPAEGVIIHSVDEDRVVTGIAGSENVPAYPTDSTPGTNTLNDAQWGVGTTYNNATYGLSISILSKTGNSFQVTITYAGGGFDFSLSNSGGVSVTLGGSGSNTVTVTLTSGTTQTVTLSASGLPSGASASFNPTSGNPTFTSTCTISTLSSTLAGSYTVTVTGTGGGKTRTTTFTLTVNPSDFARISSMTFQSGENGLYSAVIDPSGQYAYFGTWTAPGRVVKIRLSDMTRIGAISLLSGENNLSWGVIDPGGQYAYFGTYTSPGRVVKIGLSSFTRVGAVTLNTGENEPNSGVIDRNGQFAYFCTNTIPGIIVKIRLFDMTRLGAILLQSGEDKPMSAVIDPSGQYAYFGTTSSPGKVVKIGLSTFTRIGAIAFQSGENNTFSALMDPNGQFAYFGTTTSPGRVVKIGLSSFTRVGAVTLNTGEDQLTSAVIDPSGQYAYFGTWTAPGRVVKIRLSDMTRIGAISLLSSENSLTSAVIDPNGQYAYFGTDTSPGRAIKISLPLPGFYFSLSNSGGISVTPGGSGSNTITVTLRSGTTQTVTLSASGLPLGATASFIPASGNPTYSSICTITTTSSTPTGSYTVTVTGTAGGITRVTMFTLSSPVGQAVTTLFANTSYTLGFMVTGNIYDDSGTGYMCAHRSPPKILFPKTDTSKVLSTGQLTWSGYTHLVTVGGRGANPTTAYYEDNGLAPLWYFGNSTNAVIMKGSEIKLNVPFSSLGPTNDYFVIQIIADGSHKVAILYGITQYGTYASGIYFDFTFPSLNTLSQGWYIMRWQDLNGNGIPDYPAEFTVYASGT